jgi:putative membrane protein
VTAEAGSPETPAIPPPGAAGAARAEPGWRWLSPRSLVVRPVTDLIRLLPVLAGVLLFGSSRGSGGYWGMAFAGLAIGASVVRYCTTRYRITSERVYLRSGLLSQKVVSVPRDRIRAVDLSAHVIYRVLGLRKVTVGTGRSDRRDDSLHLDALTLADAEALRASLLARPAAPAPAAATADADSAGAPLLTAGAAPAPEPERELARLAPGWVRFAPLTLTGLVIVGVVVGTTAQVVDAAHVDITAVGPVRQLFITFSRLTLGERILDVAAAILVALVLLSVAGYVALFWNFRLVAQAHQALRVSRGLLTTRTITIDTRRLRGAEISEPLLLRAAGGARCLAITTGLRVGHGAERGGSLLLPPAPRRAAAGVAAAVLHTAVLARRADLPPASDAGLPSLAGLLTGDLVRHGPAARRRRYVRAVGGAALLAAAALGAWGAGVLSAGIALGSLALLPLAALLAADRYRSLGHRLDGGWLVTRTGSLVRRRSVLAADGIIGWRVRQSWFQRRQGLVSLSATTAAGRQEYVAHDIPAAAAVDLAARATPALISPFRAGPPGGSGPPPAGCPVSRAG